MCLPIIFGCPTHIKPEGEQVLQLCPRCHNVTVLSAKSTTWFELFWIPLVPFSRKHIWICGTCQWRQPKPKEQTELQTAASQTSASAPQATTAPKHPGYQPEYTGQAAPKS